MGMETKSAGRVGMSVISVPVQVSNHWPHSGFSFLCVWMMVTYPTLDRRRQHRPQTCRQSAVATVPVAAVPNTSNIRLSSRYNNTVTHHSISKPHYRNKWMQSKQQAKSKTQLRRLRSSLMLRWHNSDWCNWNVPLVSDQWQHFFYHNFLQNMWHVFVSERVPDHYEHCSSAAAACDHFSKIPKALSICNGS